MAAKKTTKKTAKKTFSPAKKTIPNRRITIDELTMAMTEIAKNHAKTEAAIDRLTVQNQKISVDRAEDRAKTEAALRELSADLRKTIVAVRELSKNMGGLNNSFGFFVEVVVVPKMRTAINAIGKHTFNRVFVDKKISAKGKKLFGAMAGI